MENILIIGGQGKFGSKLYRRLSNVLHDSATVLRTASRDETMGLVEHADTIVLTVRPEDIENILISITPSLKKDAIIISCAAKIPLQTIAGITKRKSYRMMADPWWNTLAILGEKNYDSIWWASRISTNTQVRVCTDVGIDKFTVVLSYLFVALLLTKIYEGIEYAKHVRYGACYFKISTEEAFNYLPDEKPEDTLRTIATPGGISEQIMSILIEKKSVRPGKLVKQVLKEKFSA